MEEHYAGTGARARRRDVGPVRSGATSTDTAVGALRSRAGRSGARKGGGEAQGGAGDRLGEVWRVRAEAGGPARVVLAAVVAPQPLHVLDAVVVCRRGAIRQLRRTLEHSASCTRAVLLRHSRNMDLTIQRAGAVGRRRGGSKERTTRI